ncbi:MAG: hypothetical protein RL062_89 [Bacteroidota bacterium]|jgi:hypothetical protein
MKKVAIMQPYFFPYLGYFQLIDSVDVYVNLDHVSFMKRSYMTRNQIKNDIPIQARVKGASQNKSCREVMMDFSEQYLPNFIKTLQHQYGKSPLFQKVMEEVLSPVLREREVSISEWNITIIQQICQYLDIQTEIISTSSKFEHFELKREAGLKSIVHQLNGDIYVNAIGGQALYDKDDFLKDGIQLNFIQMEELSVENRYASILDLMMQYDAAFLKEELKKYTLI